MSRSTAAALAVALAASASAGARAQTPPLNVAPVDAEVDVSRSPVLEIHCATFGFIATQYEIARDSGFIDVAYDSGENTHDLCSHVAFADLSSLTAYFWRARIKDAGGLWSEWSQATTFTTVDASALYRNVFQDGILGFSGTRDADIRGSYANPNEAIREWNQGGQEVVRTGRRPPGSDTDEIYRALLKFDLTSLADPQAVVSAYLVLKGTEHTTPYVNFDSAQYVYRLVKPWGEGSGLSGEAPDAGEVSWTYAAFPEAWSLPGASLGSDTDPAADHKAAQLVRVIARNEAGQSMTWSSRAFVDAVREWIADPGQNQGILITAFDESQQLVLDIASREDANPFERPRLVIESTEAAQRPPNQPPAAVDDSAVTEPGLAILIPVLFNDSDPVLGPDPIHLTSPGSPAHGTVQIQGTNILYTPAATFAESDGDSFTYTVSDGEESSMAGVTVTNVLVYRRGNVNAGSGAVVNVLLVNGSPGLGLERRVDIPLSSAFEMRVNAPASRPLGPSPFAIYLWPLVPSLTSYRVLPFGLGVSAMPTPLNAGTPGRIANNLGHTNLLGTENWPGPPTQPAPSILLNLPGGLPRPLTFFVQGFIADRGSIQGRAAVTNGVLVVSQ